MKLITLFLLAAAAWGQQLSVDRVMEPHLAVLSSTVYGRLNGAGLKAGAVGYAPKTGSITHVIYAVWWAAPSQPLSVGIYTVDAATAFPTATAYGGMSAGTQASVADDTVYRTALATPASATYGDPIAPVIEYVSDVGDVAIATGATQNYMTSGGRRTRGVKYNGSAWSEAGPSAPTIYVEYSDGEVLPIGQMEINQKTQNVDVPVNVNSGSADPHIGNKFTARQSLLADRVCARIGNWGASATTIFRVANSARATIASTAAIASASEGDTTPCFPLTTPVVIQKGISYYLLSIPQSANNVAIYKVPVISTWKTYSPDSAAVVSVTGTQETALTESSSYVWTMYLMGKAINASGGFATVQ